MTKPHLIAEALAAFNARRLLPFATLDDLRRDFSDPSHAERKAESDTGENWKRSEDLP